MNRQADIQRWNASTTRAWGGAALLALLCAGRAHADEPPVAAGPQEEEHRAHRFLPVPVLRTEAGVGFTVGVRGRYVYRLPEDRLNRVQVDLVSRVSVKRVQHHEVRLRTRDLAGRNEVLGFGLEFRDDPVFAFSGIDNEARLSVAELVTPFYEGHQFTFGPDVNAQLPVGVFAADEWFGPTDASLRAFLGWRFKLDRLQADEGTLLHQQRPGDLGVTRRASTYLGLSWDSRDNDWSPQRGGFHDVSVISGGPWAGGDRTWIGFNASLRSYRSLGTPKLILASQLLGEHLTGDVPLLALGEFSGLSPREGVGGLDTGRGFMRRRFVGRTKLYSSVELRYETREFAIGRRTLTPAVKPFLDVGWVHDAGPFSPHLGVSGGLGLYALWDRFEVIRLDVGFSPEGATVMMAADHAF